MRKLEKEDPSKRFWWLILVVTPLVAATIALLPSLIEKIKQDRQPEVSGIAAERQFYWNHINQLTQMLERRVGSEAGRFSFRKYYEGCTFNAGDSGGRKSLGSESQGVALASIDLSPYTASPLFDPFNFDDLRADSDKAFKALDTLGRALASRELEPYVFLLETSSVRIKDEKEATLYTQITADAIREYLVAKFGISRCRLIARGVGSQRPVGLETSASDTFTIKNFFRMARS